MAAILTEIRFKGLNDILRAFIEAESNAREQDDLFLRTEVTAGLVFASAGLLVLIGFIALVGRICNAEHEQSSRRIFTLLVRNSV